MDPDPQRRLGAACALACALLVGLGLSGCAPSPEAPRPVPVEPPLAAGPEEAGPSAEADSDRVYAGMVDPEAEVEPGPGVGSELAASAYEPVAAPEAPESAVAAQRPVADAEPPAAGDGRRRGGGGWRKGRSGTLNRVPGRSGPRQVSPERRRAEAPVLPTDARPSARERRRAGPADRDGGR